MRQIELTSKLVLALIAVILVTAIVTLPYQNQEANAQPTKRYDIRVTLTDVPANAEDLIMNVTIFGPSYLAGYEEKTVSSPSEGETIRFVLRVPAGGNENSLIVCANTNDFRLSDCDLHSLPSTGGSSPIRVDLVYPLPR